MSSFQHLVDSDFGWSCFLPQLDVLSLLAVSNTSSSSSKVIERLDRITLMRSSNRRIIDAVHTAVASVGLHSGCYARLDGLSKRVDLNGTVVRLTQWNKKKSRWIVEVMKFKNDTTLLRHEKKEKEKDLLRVKPTNLCAFIAPMLPLDATLS